MSVVKRQGIKNTLYGYIGIVLGIISTLYIQPFFLSKEEIGLTRTIISASIILAVVSNLGTTITSVKFLPLFFNPEKKHNGFFTLVLLFPLIGFIVNFALIFTFKESILHFYGVNSIIFETYAIPIILMTLFNCWVSSFSSYCNAINKSSLATVVNEVVSRVIFIVCIILLYFGVTTQSTYIYSLSLSYLIQMVILFFVINHFDHPTFSLSFFKNNIHLRQIVVFGLTTSFIQITGIGLKYIDVIFVGKYETMKDVGVYTIAAFIGLVLETPLNAIERIAGTKIAKLFMANNMLEIEKIYNLSSKYLMLFCGFFGAILITCINPVLSLLPNDYSAGTWVTIIVCLGAFFNSVTGVNYSIITYSAYYKLSAIFYAALLVVTVWLNMWLIPLYGITGAAIASCIISVIHNLLRFILIKVKFNMQPFTLDSLKIVFIVCASVLISYTISVENKYLLVILRGMASSIIFIGLLILLKVFSIKEIKTEIASFKQTFM